MDENTAKTLKTKRQQGANRRERNYTANEKKQRAAAVTLKQMMRDMKECHQEDTRGAEQTEKSVPGGAERTKRSSTGGAQRTKRSSTGGAERTKQSSAGGAEQKNGAVRTVQSWQDTLRSGAQRRP